MQVYLSEHIAPSAYARLARHFEIVDNFDHPEQLAAMIIRRAPVPRSVIAHAPNLKVIAMHGVSRDTIDTAAAAEFGVPVPNVPGLGAPAVAELAVAELLALNRQLKFVNNGLCAGRFDHFGAEEFVCHEMTGRTLGLVGTGNIAHRVADILRAAFDVRVLCWNPHRTAAECAAWGYEQVETLQELFRRSDFVNVSITLCDETRASSTRRCLPRRIRSCCSSTPRAAASSTSTISTLPSQRGRSALRRVMCSSTSRRRAMTRSSIWTISLPLSTSAAAHMNRSSA